MGKKFGKSKIIKTRTYFIIAGVLITAALLVMFLWVRPQDEYKKTTGYALTRVRIWGAMIEYEVDGQKYQSVLTGIYTADSAFFVDSYHTIRYKVNDPSQLQPYDALLIMELLILFIVFIAICFVFFPIKEIINSKRKFTAEECAKRNAEWLKKNTDEKANIKRRTIIGFIALFIIIAIVVTLIVTNYYFHKL